MKVVERTTDQSARVNAPSDDRTIVGLQKSSPLVPQVGGELAQRESDRRLVRAEHRVRVVTLYLEVGAS
jgi:hypothetical protein